MTFGGEVAMPAAGESTAEEAQTISVDSVTTEEERKPQNQSAASSSRQRAVSLPKTSSQKRSSSSGQGVKASERRPSKSVIKSRTTIKKVKDREPLSSPEQPKSRSSSRSATRRSTQDRQSSPSTISRRSAAPTPPSQSKGDAKSNFFEGDTADAALDEAFRSQKRRLPIKSIGLSLVSQPQSISHQLIEQLMHAEEKMRVAHQEDIQRHEEMAMSLLTRMNEMFRKIKVQHYGSRSSNVNVICYAMQWNTIKYIKVRSLITFVVSRELRKPVKLNIYATKTWPSLYIKNWGRFEATLLNRLQTLSKMVVVV